MTHPTWGRWMILCGLLWATWVSAASAPARSAPRPHGLMPVPASVQFRDGRLPVTTAFSFSVRGHTDRRLEGALQRALRRLEGRTGLTVSRQPVEPEKATLLVEVKTPGNAIPALGDDESYTLEVDGSRATLRAAKVVGAAARPRDPAPAPSKATADGFYLPAVAIYDRPRFPWRGLLIDVAATSSRWRSSSATSTRWPPSSSTSSTGTSPTIRASASRAKSFPKLHQHGLGRPLLHAGAGARGHRLRRRRAASASCPSSTCPATRRAGSSATRSWRARRGLHHRAQPGHLRPDARPDARGGLQVPRRLPRRDGRALPRRLHAHRRRREHRQAVGREPADPGLHEGERPQGQPRAPDLLQPAGRSRSFRSTASG